MFHTRRWLLGYAFGKLGEVKLPNNPVNSRLHDNGRKPIRANKTLQADMRSHTSVISPCTLFLLKLVIKLSFFYVFFLPQNLLRFLFHSRLKIKRLYLRLRINRRTLQVTKRLQKLSKYRFGLYRTFTRVQLV